MPPDERRAQAGRASRYPARGAPEVVRTGTTAVDEEAVITVVAAADTTTGVEPAVVDLTQPPAQGEASAASHPGVEAHRRTLRRWAIGSGVLVAMVTGGVALSYTSLFAARVVDVQGETRLGPRRVLRIAGVGAGTNVAHLDEGVVEARLKAEPWISDATVTTELPATISIEIVERTPVLVVAEGRRLRSVADDGTVLGLATRGTGLPEFAVQSGTTPGPEELRSAAEVTGVMPPMLRARVTSVSVSVDGEVSLVVDGDVPVRYGGVLEATAKAQALRAILAFAEREGKELLAIDVTAPVAPTARFVGSYRPVIGPDPSADVTASGRDPAERADGSSPSSSP